MTAIPTSPPVSRNDPCPCGSGRRFKYCHGAVAAAGPGPAVAAGAASRAGGDAEANFHLGNLARARADAAAAIRHYRAALETAPQHPALLNNLGLAYESVQQLESAEACFRDALRAAPSGVEPVANLAQNLYQQKRYAEALVLFDRLTEELHVDAAAIWANRAVCQGECRQYAGAIASLKRALALTPEAPLLRRDLLRVCCEAHDYEEAYRAYEAIQARDGTAALGETDLLQVQLHLAIWDDLPVRRARQLALAADRVGGEPAEDAEYVQPFHLQVICDDPALILAAARSQSGGSAVREPAPRSRRPAASPLRLGFAGSHFHDHPVARLLVNLLEHLDRTRFEPFVYAVSPGRDDALQRRIRAACVEYRDAGEAGFDQLAARVRGDSIDVLFDLNGYTSAVLLRAFALRPAPMQVNFLGYTGTMGSRAYDYLVTDHYCVGSDDLRHLVERPLYVDPCYLPSDARRAIDPSPLRRADYGLPEGGFVYCAMANVYKIVPEMFDVWMRLLQREPSAVLWLRDAGEPIRDRLRREAARRGADPARLHFAQPEPESRYLARFRLADVLLDTAPFGAHTTVNDAIYAGLPVIALRGACFHSRASASQLVAAGLGGLVATDLGGYAALARRICVDSSWRAQVTARARAARAGPLFDIAGYARKFEECLTRAWNGPAAGASAR